MSSKEKILQYLSIKGISIYRFEKDTGISNGSLKSGKEFGTSKLKNIRDKYPDINMDWLIYDEGEMFKSDGNQENTFREEGVEYQKTAIIDDAIKNLIDSKVSNLQEQIKTLLDSHMRMKQEMLLVKSEIKKKSS